MTRRLIALERHDLSWFDVDGQRWVEDFDTVEVDAGPATPEQIAASDADQPCGFIRVDDRGDVVEPGSWDDQRPGVRTCYVEAER